MRNVRVHIRGVLVGSIISGLLAIGVTFILPQSFTTSSTLRVVPPEGQLNPDLLTTAVDWYVALGDVPSVLQAAATGTSPSMSPTEVRDDVQLKAGGGPGEVVIEVRTANEEQALDLNNVMAEVLVKLVAADPTLQLGQTQLAQLVPAESASPSGSGRATLFVTGFLVGFVLLATGAGLLHRYINWRLSPRVLRSLGHEQGIRSYGDEPAFVVFLATMARTAGQCWVAAGPSVTASDWNLLAQKVNELGEQLTMHGESAHAAASASPGDVFQPTPNDGSPRAVAAAGVVGLPCVVMVPRKIRISRVRGLLQQLRDADVSVMALGMVPQSRKAAT